MREPNSSRHRTTSGLPPNPVGTCAATPAWMNISVRPLESALRPSGEPHSGAVATLWPVGQDDVLVYQAPSAPAWWRS
ncbi:MAG TPA: hypothetical protein VK453_12045 [Micromonosporaceae bacterium]|nr:hypothetical protein [Micromonosporaceae bacterium]